MKQLSFLLLAVSLFIACGTTKTASNSKDQKITGHWRLTSIESGQELDQETKDAMDAMMDIILADAYFEIRADKSFTMHMGNEESTGTWRLSEDGTQFITTLDGTDNAMKIVTLDKNNLVLGVTDDTGTLGKLVLNR